MIRSARLVLFLNSPEFARFAAKPPKLTLSAINNFAGIPPPLRVNSHNSLSNRQSHPSTPRDTKSLPSMEIDGKPSSVSDIPVAKDAPYDEPLRSSADEPGRDSGPGASGNPISEDLVQSDGRTSDDGEFRDSESEGSQRRALPEDLAKDVVMLSCESSVEGGSCDVYLIGTAHVSKESCILVQAVVSHLKPQVVFLELCPSRVAILTPQTLKVPTMREMMDSWKQKNSNMLGVIYSWFLAKVAQKLEVFPGAEFRVAFEEALRYGGKVILGDRPVHITLRRTWGKMPLWHKVKFLFKMSTLGLSLPDPDDLNKMLKEMGDADMLTLVIQEMSKTFPTLSETLVFERDRYMSSTLIQVAQEHASVVAVVGKGHVQGIKKHWKQPVVMKDLLEIPARKSGASALKIVTTIGVAIAGVVIISSFFVGGKR
ncbi:hypothetical protein Sjap_003339 [Stephania japonica]|uniref:TraB domain-containing protein n=1 Tax=Stephania japonica TaxID=461633 RepID=A0AAP0PVC5_9MAGN